MADMDGRTVVLCVLGGFLLATAVLKIVSHARGRLAWPDGPNLLRIHIPLRVAIVAEVSAGAAPLLDHQRLAALLVFGAYAAITVGAWTLRGRDCACFGIDGLRVGRWHVAACAAATAAAAAIMVAAPQQGPMPALWISTVVVAVVGLAGGAAALRRRVEVSGGGCLDRAVRLQILTLPDCGACAGLKLLYRASAGRDVIWWEVGSDDLPPTLAAVSREVQYPCAVAVDVDGQPTCPPREGLPQCQQIIDTFRAQVRQ